MPDGLARGKDVESVRRQQPALAKLLLHTQRGLLPQGMMGIRLQGENADTADLVWPAERACKSGRPRSEVGTQTGSTRNVSGDAGGACILGNGESAVILHQLFSTGFQNDAIVEIP